MRKKIILIVLFFVINFLVIDLHGQILPVGKQDTLPDRHRWAFGVEAGAQTGNIFVNSNDEFRGRFIGGVFSFPLKLAGLTMGTGVQFVTYAWIDEATYTGDKEVTPAGDVGFWHLIEERKFSYINVPLRLQYTFKCDCFYIQAGFQPGILKHKSELKSLSLLLEEQPDQPYGELSNFNISAEVGAGFRLYFTEHIRIYIQPSFVRVMLPYYSFYGTELGYSFLRVSFGAEYAF